MYVSWLLTTKKPVSYLFFPSAPTSTSSSSSSSSTAGSATLLGRLFRRQSSSSSSSPSLDSGIFPNTTLGRTLLNASELVRLPGNNSQVLAWTKSSENSNVTILNQAYVFTSSSSLSPPLHLLNRWFKQVLILTLVKTSLSSTLPSGTPYSSTALMGYLSLLGISPPHLMPRTRLLLPTY